MSQLDSEKEEQTKSLVSLVTMKQPVYSIYVRTMNAINTFSFLLFQSSAVSLVNLVTLVTVSEGFTAEDEQTFQNEHEVKFIVSFVFHAGGGWGKEDSHENLKLIIVENFDVTRKRYDSRF